MAERAIGALELERARRPLMGKANWKDSGRLQ